MTDGMTVHAYPTQPDCSVGLIGRTCPPRQCGIATFSKDLEHALQTADPSVSIKWAAINEATSIHPYGPEVGWRIRQGDPEAIAREPSS